MERLCKRPASAVRPAEHSVRVATIDSAERLVAEMNSMADVRRWLDSERMLPAPIAQPQHIHRASRRKVLLTPVEKKEPIWQVKCRGAWCDLSHWTNIAIEMAYTIGRKDSGIYMKPITFARTDDYCIDFVAMEETNLSTKKIRPARRSLRVTCAYQPADHLSAYRLAYDGIMEKIMEKIMTMEKIMEMWDHASAQSETSRGPAIGGARWLAMCARLSSC